MALVEEVKKGGPYTKKEQNERRQEVFKLHFEKGYSAMKISEILNVNRNTINEDIRYWYSELTKELKQHDVATWAIEQFHSFEIQKNRLYELLEKEESVQHKLAIEKLIFQTNDKVSQLALKIISSKAVVTYPQDEEEIMGRTKDFVRYILLDDKIKPHERWGEGNLLFNIIKRYKCDVDCANSIFKNMEKLGLHFCGTSETVTNMYGLLDTMTQYDILKFAEMRGFLSENEIRQVKR